MKRLAALMLLAGCLEPGGPLFYDNDRTAPFLIIENVTPRIFGADAGLATVQAGQFIELPFSESLDQDSLRAGILIRTNPERNEIPLLIQAPPPGVSPYTVRVASGERTFVTGIYTMQLRTLLIDIAGNPIDLVAAGADPDDTELTGFFRVP